MTTPPPWVESAAGVYAAGRPLALLFDYDGTLTPIVSHPSLALLPAATRTLLARLAALPNVAVGGVSGRALADLQRLLDLPGVYHAGSGGLELDLLGEARRYPIDDALAARFTALHSRIEARLPGFGGAWVERKPGALSAHYRALAPAAAADFVAEMAVLLGEFPALRWRLVSESVEVTPADGWDKGTAVAAILTHAGGRFGQPPLPLFFGDAPNDAEAMEAVNASGGETVGIGPDAPHAAKHRLGTPAGLAAALEDLADRCTPAD